jgi:CDP-6-deoxy-D-xylo-4-hexulose-3-dehydrase
MTDLQASVGLAQLDKLGAFAAARRANFARLCAGLAGLEEFLVLPEPTPGSDPCWFGFPVAVRPGAPFGRADLVAHLESRRIATRPVFAGNLLRQPAYRGVEHRKIGELPNTDFVMDRAFWVGVYPGITPEMTDFMAESFHAFCAEGARGH